MKPASYSIIKFKDACKQGLTKVRVIQGAQKTAKTDFSLNTDKDILNFIGYGGLEKLKFIRTKLWMNNPDHNEPIMVDSYNFYSNSLYGYIAFMCVKRTEEWEWAIKSFKKNIEPGVRNPAFEDLKKLIH